MAVERSTSHVARGVKRWIGPLRQPKLQAWVSTSLKQIQKLEDAAWEVADYLNLTDGFGKILDMFGSLLDRGRNGLDDDDYRVALYAQGRILRAIGNDADVKEIGDLSTQLTDVIVTRDFPPASFVIECVIALPVALDPLVANLATIKPLGSRCDFVWNTAERADTFICGIDTDRTIGEGAQGCGLSSDPDLGGRLSVAMRL